MLFETLCYGEDHSLQTVTVAKTSTTPLDAGYWVILIHGGAWRDPTQTANEYLKPAAEILSTSNLPNIAAFTSINYRLSPHPNYPQDPSTTKPDEFRAARHPDHIHDVQAALAFLQHKYGFGSRYILVGHSCGATLAFQSVMGQFFKSAGGGGGGGAREYSAPTAIVGMAGIYDLRLLRDKHKEISEYQKFIESAFGSNEEVWDSVSPAVAKGFEGVVNAWDSGRLAVLAHSSGDSLVDFSQRDLMKDVLVQWIGASQAGKRQVETLDIEGEHDEAWEKGGELAKTIGFTLEKLQEMGP